MLDKYVEYLRFQFDFYEDRDVQVSANNDELNTYELNVYFILLQDFTDILSTFVFNSIQSENEFFNILIETRIKKREKLFLRLIITLLYFNVSIQHRIYPSFIFLFHRCSTVNN